MQNANCTRQVKSSSLPLPPEVRAAAEAAIGGGAVKEEFAWMSWAGTVWRLTGDTDSVFVKRATELAGERDRLAWLNGRWPVPQVVVLLRAAGDDWLVTRAHEGEPTFHPSVGLPPPR